MTKAAAHLQEDEITLDDLRLLQTVDAGAVEEHPRPWAMTQKELQGAVPVQAARKRFDLRLEGKGNYSVDYTEGGRHLLLGGERGHVAAMEWQSGRLLCELNLDDTVHDLCWLQNETMFACAQSKHVYIYDHTGAEMHRLASHTQPRSLAYLRYHWLLASLGDEHWVRWQDISTGQLVAEWRSQHAEGMACGRGVCMSADPATALMHVGHASGTVSLWAPSTPQPLVRMLCHRGPVTALSVTQNGQYIATAGADGWVKVWDLRTFREVSRLKPPLPATSLSFSQRGLLAIGSGGHVQVWRDAHRKHQHHLHLRHGLEGPRVHDVQFCPWEDVLAVGHSAGLSSLLVPGAGEPNYDALECNPYATARQRQEQEVRRLLEKLAPASILLDPKQIGRVQPKAEDHLEEMRLLQQHAERKEPVKEKKKMRGRSTALKRYQRKRSNIMDHYKQEAAEKERIEKVKQSTGAQPDAPRTALDRFIQ